MFDWKRFLCLEDQDHSLGDDGFLYDPDSEYGHILNPNAFAFDQINDHRCVVILGEPGIGKSNVLNDEYKRKEDARQEGENVHYFDLGEYTSESSLITSVLQKPALTSSKTTLFLDSLDECKIRVSNVSRLVKREFRELKEEKECFSLRIACRTADWPASLTDLFCEIWGRDKVVVAKVLPLRRKDVLEAASVSGIDAEYFVQKVIEVGCQSLALKPVTLKFLIEHFQDQGELTTDQIQLYESGCLALCSENNIDRRESGDVGELTPSQRLEVASRIAAISIFCRRPLVVCNQQNPNSAQFVTVREIAGYTETVQGNEFVVSENFVMEALNTGLFTGKGPDCFGFAHQSYAEFLASRYLDQRRLDSTEIEKLVFSDSASLGSKIHPQLIETFAWIPSKNKELFDVALANDPQAIIGSDVAKADESARYNLTSRLLELFRHKEISASGFEEVKHYPKLNNLKMADQLGPYIQNHEICVDARAFALKLAAECEIEGVQDDCLKVALSSEEPYYLRCQAARTLARIGDDDRLAKLTPLAKEPIEQDEDLTLFTIVVRRLWPALISAEDLFSILTTPRRDTYGSYGYFLSHELPEKLKDDDLQFALNWAAERNEIQSSEFSVRDLISNLSKQAWKKLWHPGVLDSMASFCHSRLGMHCSFVELDDDQADEEDKRRAIVEKVLKLIGNDETDAFSLIHRSPRLLRSTDVYWLLNKLAEEESLQTRVNWAKLLRYIVDFSNPEHLESIKDAAIKYNEVLIEFDKDLEALNPESEEAKRRKEIREAHQRRMDEMETRRNPPPLDPPPAVRVKELMDLCEQGVIEHWFSLTRDLQLEENSTHYRNEFEKDITVLPGWENLSEHDHGRMITFAKAFLESEQCKAPEYFGKNSTPIWDYAGYKALVLLAKLAPDEFDGLSNNAWNNWAASIVDHLHGPTRSDDIRSIDKLISERCVEKSPKVVADSIMAIVQSRLSNATLRIEAKKKNGNQAAILPQISQRIWNETIRSAFYELAQDRTLQCKVTALLVDRLLENDCAESVDLARDLLKVPIPKQGRERGLVIMVGKSILSNAPDGAWAILKPIIDTEPRIAKLIVSGVAERDFHNCKIATHLTENELADFYIWLEQHFPRASDPDRWRSGFVGSRESVANYRDCVLRILEHRGTEMAIEALQRIGRELPHLDWMHRVVASARRIALRECWRPIGVDEFMLLTRCDGKTLVKSEKELQSVVIESLTRLQTKLQGETPAAPDLWDTKVWQPKDENHLSDYIKRHLETDLQGRGIIALREVEIRRGEGKDIASGKGKGERTDVHVTGLVPAITPGEFDPVRVIVEVKGSWHAEVDTAMETQLRNRYLRENDCSHGIYLVGWYLCEQWNKNDNRNRKSRNESFEGYQSRFSSQAADLVSPPYIKAFVLNCSLR